MKQSKKPLLSICIPTYNRCDILNDVLSKYVNNSQFDNDVEIIVSDNASTDSTEEICRNYVNKYSNIKYFKNDINVNDKNFSIVLDNAEGEYLKLLNDWIYLDDEGLKYIKDRIKNHLHDKKPLFFTSNWIDTNFKNKEFFVCSDLNEYILAISTFITSNNLFGVWKSDWAKIINKNKYCEYHLQQDDWTYQILQNGNGCIIYNKDIYIKSKVTLKGKKTGYNWFQVHLDYYYKIMDPYVKSGLISKQTLKNDKRHLLVHFYPELQNALIINTSKYWQFDTKHTWCYLWRYYKTDPYFYFFIVYLYNSFFFKLPIKLLKKCITLIFMHSKN